MSETMRKYAKTYLRYYGVFVLGMCFQHLVEDRSVKNPPKLRVVK